MYRWAVDHFMEEKKKKKKIVHKIKKKNNTRMAKMQTQLAQHYYLLITGNNDIKLITISKRRNATKAKTERDSERKKLHVIENS